METLPKGNSDLIVGIDSSDDSAVYKIDDKRAIVQTLDIITPVVDDPYSYGQVAAANSLSDIFAMGADVITALNIVGFDGCNHQPDVLKEILAGGSDKVSECGGVVVGGHTIDTPEMTYGLSVTGLIDIDNIYRNNTPKVGDKLILTKPLGIGVLTTAIKADLLPVDTQKRVVSIMTQLNYKASLTMKRFRVNACTDITGFGLAGHAKEMAQQRVTLYFSYSSLPILKEAVEYSAMGLIPAGSYANKEYIKAYTNTLFGGDDIIFYDAQTSGGLLLSVQESDADDLLKALIDDGYEYSAIIGEVREFANTSLVLDN